MGGSVVMGRATESSDLDMVVLTRSRPVHRHLNGPQWADFETASQDGKRVSRRPIEHTFPALRRLAGSCKRLIAAHGVMIGANLSSWRLVRVAPSLRRGRFDRWHELSIG